MTMERGLGKGLDSLLRSTRVPERADGGIEKLALDDMVPASNQPRKYFEESTLAELAQSIKQQGVVQPLIVRPQKHGLLRKYEIVAGERRWRAAKLAGLTEVPVVIAEYNDVEALTVALVENLQREDLNPLEEAEALQSLRQAHDLSQEELAARLGKSRPAVANSLRLLQLPEEVRMELGSGKISAGHARTLLSITDESVQKVMLHAILRLDLSVRECETAADYWKRKGVLPPELESVLRMTDAAEAPKVKPSKRQPKTPWLKEMQKGLRASGLQGAAISGTEDKGRIALPYSSRGELEFLLNLLGMSKSGGENNVPEQGTLEGLAPLLKKGGLHE